MFSGSFTEDEEGKRVTSAFGISVALHILMFLVLYTIPRPEMQAVPIKSLNIRLGDGEEGPASVPVAPESSFHPAALPVQPDGARAPVLPKAETPVKEMQTETKPQDPLEAVRRANQSAGEAQRLVRDNGVDGKGTGGSPLGNSSAINAEILQRYTQTISLWIQRHMIYPPEAQKDGAKGQALLRIRIDRQGSIRFYQVEQSTGDKRLDKAAIEMIQRANPVPAVPQDYPMQGALMEFLVPVNFSLE